ncbi:MAG: hypothetical protein OXU69_11950 [Gemmatimonadota bacterium]|nr:hypothetical protein [Gemmatimonadota bacterium]MDE2985409.1 hypothetical protein [Gemmatimonadota bacterium]
MFGDALSWYMTSMAEFWGSAFRIGLPQILIIIFVICWLRKKGGSKSCGKGCGWMWCCKGGGDEEEGAWSDWEGDCGCSCGSCCCRQGGETDADDEGDGDE